MTSDKIVWLIRHGQTDWNAQHRWQGHEPTHLNANGLAEADKLAEHLKDIPLDIIYSSDLPRAYETAQPLATQRNLTIQHDVRLREVNVGAWGGLNRAEVEAKYGEALARWFSGDIHFRIPEGESRRDLQVRMMAAFNDIVATDNAHIAIVSHGGSINAFLRGLFHEGTPSPIPLQLVVPNTSYTQLVRENGQWTLRILAATEHLSADKLDDKK